LFCVNLKPKRVSSEQRKTLSDFFVETSSCSASDFIHQVTVSSTISFLMAITMYPTLQYPSSVRTWSVAAPVRACAECDLKTLLCSYSFKASALMGNDAVVTGNFTTAEQRVSRVDSAASSSSHPFLLLSSGEHSERHG
jgi:hypothetical protein